VLTQAGKTTARFPNPFQPMNRFIRPKSIGEKLAVSSKRYPHFALAILHAFGSLTAKE
jgi:hypothetical protein